jgi:hypothetical protein
MVQDKLKKSSLESRIIPIPIIDDIFTPYEVLFLWLLMYLSLLIFIVPTNLLGVVPIIGDLIIAPLVGTSIFIILSLVWMIVWILYLIIFIIIW